MSKGELRMFQLLDAAETILVRDGADALTLREVAKEAGITLGNLQYYFPTRAKLLEAIFERYATEFRAERAAVIDGVEDSREMLIGVVDYWLKTELRHEQGGASEVDLVFRLGEFGDECIPDCFPVQLE